MGKDPWAGRSKGMVCETCIFFVLKGETGTIGRCRRHAPRMGGFPVVYTDDWCGDHRLDELVGRTSTEIALPLKPGPLDCPVCGGDGRCDCPSC